MPGMRYSKAMRSIPLYLLVLLVGTLGLGAVYGGGLLVLAPSGLRLGLPIGFLEHSPFSNFLVPGLLLLVFVGLLALLVAYGLVARPNWPYFEKLNVYTDRHWAWTFTLYTGFSLGIWINVQLLMLDAHSALQPTYGLVALAILVLALLPPVMTRYNKKS